MGTTSEKLTYLNGTKQLLKDKINNLGGSIDDNTTFRQYANQLQNVYDNLPKTEYQEGTEVNLGVTTKGKLDYENGVVGIGQTEQESTQGYNKLKLISTDIKTANSYYGGTWTENKYVLNGVTFDMEVNSQGVVTKIKISGTSSAQTTFYLFNGNNYFTSGDYMLSGCTNGSNTTYDLRAYNINGGNEVKQNFTTPVSVTSNGGTQGVNVAIVVRASQTITNVEIAPMLETGSTAHNWEQYTGGYSSPSPNWEQEIKYVRGRNKLKVDFEAVSVNGIDFSSSEEEITITGTTTASANTIVGQTTLPKGSYTLSCTNMAYAWGTSRIEVSGTGIDTLSFFSGTLVRQLTLSQETALTFRAIVSGVGTSVNYKTKIQVEEGSTSTPYLPYNTIEEVVSGKNLFDTSIAQIGANYHNTFVDNGGSLSVTATGTYSYRTYYISGLKIGESYTVSFKGYKDENATLGVVRIGIGTVTTSEYGYHNMTTTSTDYSLTFIATDEIVHICVYPVLTNYTSGGTISLENIQIEQGSTTTTYEPYITPTSYQLSLGDIELCGIGNYKDELIYDVDEDKVYKNEKVGKIVLDGSNDENWQMDYNTGFVSNRFTCDNLPSLDVTSNTNFDYGYCNIGKITSEAYYSAYLNVVKLRYINNQNRVDCMFDIESLNAFKTLLAQTPMEIYYQRLGGTELIEITDTTLINQVKALYNAHSNNGTTIITSNGDLPMIIKVRALKGE